MDVGAFVIGLSQISSFFTFNVINAFIISGLGIHVHFTLLFWDLYY